VPNVLLVSGYVIRSFCSQNGRSVALR